jgi:hypothetical protein
LKFKFFVRKIIYHEKILILSKFIVKFIMSSRDLNANVVVSLHPSSLDWQFEIFFFFLSSGKWKEPRGSNAASSSPRRGGAVHESACARVHGALNQRWRLIIALAKSIIGLYEMQSRSDWGTGPCRKFSE